MIIAQQKRKDNIAGYVLYMWQVEDLIRALNLDMERIDSVLISNYKVDDATREQLVSWYENLVVMIQKEQKQKNGHLQFLVNIVDDLNVFHQTLLTQKTDEEYPRLFYELQPDIEHVKQQSGLAHHDIEVALNTLYIIMMLKMSGKEVTEGTQKAVWKFGNFMDYMSKLYKAWEAGDLEL